MKLFFNLFSFSIILLTACDPNQEENPQLLIHTQIVDSNKANLNDTSLNYFGKEDTIISTTFEYEKFPEAYLEQLLVELRICNPQIKESNQEGEVPCSAKFFHFYSCNDKLKIENTFILQIKKGVGNFPYRRLLIFTRENGVLVKMNGIIGYLVKKIPSETDFDDLIVAVVDNVGGHYERYDVLLKYENGKYHYKEAIGDLYGEFNTLKLKTEATEQIGERIKERNLIY